MYFRRASAGWSRGTILGVMLLGAASCGMSGCRSSARPAVIPAVKGQETYMAATPAAGQPQIIKETTIIKEKESHSILGLVFYKIGDIVALPFKIIGLVFDTVL